MILQFNGLVETGDDCRVYEDQEPGAIIIAGRDVVNVINAAKFTKPVTIGIMDERFKGHLSIEFGWGYSEWTPMDSDVLKVGSHDLIEILKRYKGQIIKMFVADEPFNIIDADFEVVGEL